jgi:4a-hydroxytetrahydrobiopterin dehydratase
MACVPCRKGEPALTATEIAVLLPEIPAWDLVEVDGAARLRRRFRFKTYVEAAAFTQAITEQAEAQDHHPAILLEWRKVTVEWWTHVLDGLHQNDFIMAARCDQIFSQYQTD